VTTSEVPAAAGPGSSPLLEVRDLTVEFATRGVWRAAASDVSFSIGTGEVLGLVGESGSGKTVSSLAILGLTAAQGGRVSSGSIRLGGRELLSLSETQMRDVRGSEVGMIFQQAMRSLNPALTVGNQIAETYRRHRQATRAEAWERAVDMLDRVGIPNARQRAKDYPHQFSGGMCQRVMIAIALVCEPKLLIADEPTTALDVTVQRKILDLLIEVQAATNVSVLFISHDLGIIANMCDRVAVMYAGEIVEQAQTAELFTAPLHPYTEGLLGSIPRGRGHRLIAIPGTVPAPGEAGPGCHFFERCSHAQPGFCDGAHPPLTLTASGAAEVRCLRTEELVLEGISGS
jgi:peptide/nickel transport system ATP-binding protein